jgi:hypothetical protein
VALIFVGSFSVRATAQEHGEEHHPQAGVEEHGEHEFHRHHFAVFLGVTDGEVEKEAEVAAESEGGATTEDQRAFTLGLEYEYRLSRRWGIGALIDYAGKDFRSWVAGIPVILHPAGEWKLFAAPGLEDKADDDAEFLVRVWVLYDFEFGAFKIAPVLQVDFVGDEEVLIYGVNIGGGF